MTISIEARVNTVDHSLQRSEWNLTVIDEGNLSRGFRSVTDNVSADTDLSWGRQHIKFDVKYNKAMRD